MPLNYVDDSGNPVVIDEQDVPAAVAAGLHPESSDEQAARVSQGVQQETYGGIGGAAAALGAGALRGVSFGLSDALLTGLGGEDARAQLQGLREVNPISSTVGEIGGAIAPAFFTGGASAGLSAAEEGASLGARALAATPSGIASRIATSGYEAGKAIGGLRGAAVVGAAAGAEGALQNAGSYISDAALGDRELTAEGLSGALGQGFVFGAAGGTALYGLERGTIAARRLFARPIDDGAKAAEAARIELEQSNQRTIENYDAAAAAAQAQLDAARQASQEATVATQEATARAIEARAAKSANVETAVPNHDALDKHLRDIDADYITQHVSARDLANHGWYTPPSDSYEKTVQVLQREGRPNQVIRLTVSPEGKVVAATGGEALEAAARNGQTVRVRWTTGFEPRAEDVLRGTAVTEQSAKQEAERIADRQLVDAVKEKIANREVPGFVGPFTDDGLENAARQVIEQQRAKQKALEGAVAEYADAKAALERAQTSDTLPSYKSVARRTRKRGANEVETVVSSRDIADRGYYQQEAGFGIDADKIGEARRAVDEGTSAPIRLSVSPTGKIQVTEGRHALAAAIETGSDIRVKWSTSAEPAASLTFRAPGSAAFPPPSEAGGGDLLSQLLATKKQLDQGANLSGLARVTKRATSTSDLERQYERAIELADKAADPATKQAHLAAAADLERALGKQPSGARSVVDDIAQIAPLLTRFERAAAAVTEAAGDAAPAAAQAQAAAFRAAEQESDRKFTDRVVRSIDDTAAQNSLESPEGRIARTRAEKLRAEAELARARAAESQAKIGAQAASKASREAKAAIKAAEPAAPVPNEEESLLDSLAGFPGAHAIPVIGPMLSRYSQSKIIQALLTKFSGRVADTGGSRVAALAARVRNRISDAIDRSLGLVEGGVKLARQPALATADVLSRKIFDVDHPEPTGTGVAALAAARAKEVAAAVADPESVVARVRRELRDVHDPDLIAAAEQHQLAIMRHLNDVAPKGPPSNPYAPVAWEPSGAAAMKFARQVAAAFDPASVFEAMHQQTLTLEAAETLRAVYPKLFAEAQARLAARSSAIQTPVPYRQRMLNSLLFTVPLDRSLEPSTFATLQSAHGPSAPAAPEAPGSDSQPTPSIAAPTSLNTLYQTAADRRAIAR